MIGRQIAAGVDLRVARAVDAADDLIRAGDEDARGRAVVHDVHAIAAGRAQGGNGAGQFERGARGDGGGDAGRDGRRAGGDIELERAGGDGGVAGVGVGAERIQTPLPLLVTASCPAPLSAKTPLIVLAPVLPPLSVSVVTPLVAPGVIPPPKLSVAELLLAPLVNV